MSEILEIIVEIQEHLHVTLVEGEVPHPELDQEVEIVELVEEELKIHQYVFLTTTTLPLLLLLLLLLLLHYCGYLKTVSYLLFNNTRESMTFWLDKVEPKQLSVISLHQQLLLLTYLLRLERNLIFLFVYCCIFFRHCYYFCLFF